MDRHFHASFGDRGGHRHRGGGGRGGFFGGPFGGGFGGRGPGLRTARMLGSADLQLIILRLLSEKPRHGYEIIKAIEEHSSGLYAPSPGMVYPALTYLEEMDYAAATAEGTKKLYNITERGTDHLVKNRAAADEIWNRLGLFGAKLAHFHKEYAEDEDLAEHFASGAGGTARSEWEQWQHMKADFRSTRDELKAAIRSKMDAGLQEKLRIVQILRRAIKEIRGL